MPPWKVLPALVVGALALFACAPSGASAADLDCADFSNQAEAQENLLPGDPYRLDGDSDGTACEDLPCPCSSEAPAPGGGDPAPAPPPPPPPKLDKAAAREAAERKARKFTRRHSSLDSVYLRRCGRRSRHKVVCNFVASGRTNVRATTCHLRVVVRGEGTNASAKMRVAQCRSRPLAILSLAAAKQAMKEAAQRLAGKPVTVYALNRFGPRSFTGLAEWTQTSSAGLEELCSVELTAEKPASRSVQVSTQDLDCVQI